MIVLSTTLRFVQEMRSTVAAQALSKMVHSSAHVLRDGLEQVLDVTNLVPGDIVKLSAGSIIPGDIRLLISRDLFVS